MAQATQKEKDGKMWEGRFDEGMAPSMVELSFSLHFDRELFEEDILCSLAHGKGLVEAGVLTAEEYAAIHAGLDSIRNDLRAGKSLFAPGDEDIHMAVERVLTERIGPLGKKIHTGRSRNDQVATDFKLYIRRRAALLRSQIRTLQRTLLSLAEAHRGKLMPGYTHMQQAQPVQFSHYVLSFFFVLERDAARFAHVEHQLRELPLGSGAIAGSAFPYRRELVAQELGFEDISSNSIDATAHRDCALEFLGAIAILGATLSRYAEDMVTWSSLEFGFVSLSDAFSSGSSMMPQKKNPDSMELVRGKSGRLLGDFSTLFAVVKGAPLSYSRDLQEDKEPVFDAVRTARVLLQVMSEAYASATWRFDRMEAAMLPGLLATDLADLLVERGVPFRDAHHMVGALVGEAARRGTEFTQLPDEAWKNIPDAALLRAELTFANAVKRRDIRGGTGPSSLEWQIARAQALLASDDVSASSYG